jgi:hypothetical protein
MPSPGADTKTAPGYGGNMSIIREGLGFGAAMAMILSFSINHSVLWMIIHGILGWIYVIYRLFVGGY